MHIAITGAAGFLGQRLVAPFLDRGELDGTEIRTRIKTVAVRHG